MEELPFDAYLSPASVDMLQPYIYQQLHMHRHTPDDEKTNA